MATLPPLVTPDQRLSLTAEGSVSKPLPLRHCADPTHWPGWAQSVPPQPQATQNGAIFPPASPLLRGRGQGGKPGGGLPPPAQPPAGLPLQPQLSWNMIPSCSNAEKWEERVRAWAVGWGAQGTPASPCLPWGYTACPPPQEHGASSRPHQPPGPCTIGVAGGCGLTMRGYAQ